MLLCRDTSDAVALYLPQRLYLKPFAKLNISVQLPVHKVHGKSISNWELMEKLRKMVLPETFSVLKVSKHTSEVIRFDAEIESREKLARVIARLDDRVVQLNDFPDKLSVRVSEARSDFPMRHSWDSFFRDATDMDEMKPGERPDTIHITNIPIKWFVHERDRDEDAPPSESIFRKVFDKFGEIRQVDIPAADPFRMQMKSAMRGITTPPQDAALYFEGYVQFSEYVGFVRCMDCLRGHKLLHKRDDIAEWCDIKVDFDKSKHMTDAAVKRRAIVRERLAARQRAKDDEERTEKEKMSKREAKEKMKRDRIEREKLDKMRDREERRKKRQIAKLMDRDNVDYNTVVAEEERKMLKLQKRLQAIRLIDELFKRIEIRHKTNSTAEQYQRYYRSGDSSARHHIVEKMKSTQEQLLDEQRHRLKKAMEGRLVIRTVLETNKEPRSRMSSVSSASSDELHKYHSGPKIKKEKLTTPEREIEMKKAIGMYGMPPPYGYPYGFPMHPGFPYPQSELHHMASMYFPPPVGAYYPPPMEYTPRRPYRGRGRGRGRGRMWDNHAHNKYNDNNEHDDRGRTRSRSRRRSYSRSRSRSRSRRRSRSRSRRYTRSRSRDRRSRDRRTRSRTRSRSRRKTKSRSKSKGHTPEATKSVDSSKFISPGTMRNRRSKSWSLPKNNDKEKAWSKSPEK